jgi:outer membrane protein assembly factor BamB
VPPPQSIWPALYHDAAATNFNASEHVLGASNVTSLHLAWMAPANTLIVTPDGLFESIDDGTSPQGLFYQVVQTDAATSRSFTRFTYSTEYMSGPTDPEPLAWWPGLLVVGGPSAPGLKALSLRTDRPIWRHPDVPTSSSNNGETGLAVTGGLVVTGYDVCMRSGCGVVTAVDVRSGRIVWQHAGNDSGGGDVVVAGGRVYSCGKVGTRVYEARTGRLLYTLPWTGLWTGDSKRAYALAEYQGARSLWPMRMIAVTGSGKLIWSISVGKSELARPVLAYNTLFTVSNRFHPGVMAIDAATGRIRWADNLLEPPRPFGEVLLIAVANHLLFVMHTETGILDVLDTGTGRPLASIFIRNYSVNAPYGPGAAQLVVAGGTVYVTGGGRIRALRP